MTADANHELVNELTLRRAENARLAGLLEAHGIAWREFQRRMCARSRHRR